MEERRVREETENAQFTAGSMRGSVAEKRPKMEEHRRKMEEHRRQFEELQRLVEREEGAIQRYDQQITTGKEKLSLISEGIMKLKRDHATMMADKVPVTYLVTKADLLEYDAWRKSQGLEPANKQQKTGV